MGAGNSLAGRTWVGESMGVAGKATLCMTAGHDHTGMAGLGCYWRQLPVLVLRQTRASAGALGGAQGRSSCQMQIAYLPRAAQHWDLGWTG